MRVLDLFSGIGGFSLGLERAGMQTAAFCENDPFCRRVLAKHWPGIPIHKSIEELDGKKYRGSIELVCGGFPCQPFSVAGDQRGAEDDRALWPEMLRVIREVEPAWVIGENVTGIINMELDNCLSSLEDSGYAVQTFVIPACGVDAPHRRDRVWIIARKNDPGRGNTEERRAESRRRYGEAVADSEELRTSDKDDNEKRIEQGREIGLPLQSGGKSSNRGRAKEDVADSSFQPEYGPTDSRIHKKDAFDKGQETGITDRGSGVAGQNSLADSGSEGLQGPEREIVSGEERQSGRYIAECGEDVADPPGSRQQGQGEPEYTGNQEAHGEGKTNPSLDVSVDNERGAQPGVGGMADGVSRWMDEPVGTPRVIGACPDRVGRLKSLGNAVVPQVVEVLGKFIMEIHEEGK
jgi:DNA-cytosine methyltransferase